MNDSELKPDETPKPGAIIDTDDLWLFLREVVEERFRQDAKHGGPRHDDTVHTGLDWFRFIEHRLLNANLIFDNAETNLQAGTRDCERREAFTGFNVNAVQAAALVAAMAQSFNRRFAGSPPVVDFDVVETARETLKEIWKAYHARCGIVLTHAQLHSLVRILLPQPSAL